MPDAIIDFTFSVALDAVSFSAIKFWTDTDDIGSFVTNEDADPVDEDTGSDDVVSYVKDSTSAKCVAASIDATNDKDFVCAEDTGYFDTDKYNFSSNTAKHLDAAEDTFFPMTSFLPKMLVFLKAFMIP